MNAPIFRPYARLEITDGTKRSSVRITAQGDDVADSILRALNSPADHITISTFLCFEYVLDIGNDPRGVCITISLRSQPDDNVTTVLSHDEAQRLASACRGL